MYNRCREIWCRNVSSFFDHTIVVALAIAAEWLIILIASLAFRWRRFEISKEAARMSDDDKATYEDGRRDERLSGLERRVSWIEKLVWAMAGMIASAWAKLTGIL